MNEERNSGETTTILKAKGDSLFMYYRQAGTGLSATLIVLASAMLAWVHKSRFELGVSTKVFFWISIILFGLTIFSSLLIQYFNYKGYFNHARVLLEDSDYNKSAITYFCWADLSVSTSMIFFMGGIISSVIFKY